MTLDPVCQSFACIDLRKLPNSQSELDTYGVEDLAMLIDWYGSVRRSRNPTNNQLENVVDTVIVAVELKQSMNYSKVS